MKGPALLAFVGLAGPVWLWPQDASASRARYPWPDSQQYTRVLVNVTQGVESRPGEWFSKDRLVTDLAITNAQEIGFTEAAKQYRATRRLLESYGLVVGTYISGLTVLVGGRQPHYPYRAVPMEWMPATAKYAGPWPNLPQYEIIDSADVSTRHALQAGIQKLWTETPAPIHFVDNAAAHRSTGGTQSWSALCANIAELRKLGESMGARQIFNISVHVGLMSDDETRELMRAVGDDGIMLETPWHHSFRKNKSATAAAVKRYRELLDSGMAIIMLPLDGDPRELAQWLDTWRKPSDHVYIGGVFYKPADPEVFAVHR
jgi:hypothetical protein